MTTMLSLVVLGLAIANILGFWYVCRSLDELSNRIGLIESIQDFIVKKILDERIIKDDESL